MVEVFNSHPVVFHRDADVVVVSAYSYPGIAGLRMFNDIKHQLPHRTEEQDFDFIIHGDGEHIFLYVHLEAVLRPEVAGEPIHCRLKAQLVKYREAQFEGQGSGVLDHLIDELPHLAQ